MPEQETTSTQGETPATTTAQAETATTSTNTNESGEKPPWGDDFNPERAWSTIQKLRTYEDEVEALRKEKADREKAAADAERKRMEENQEYQKLAEQTQAELDSLKPEAERAKRYEAELKAIYEAELATLSEQARRMVEGLPGNPDMIDRLTYLRENADLLKPQTQRSGVPDTPRSNSNGMSRDELIAQEIAAQRSGRGRPY